MNNAAWNRAIDLWNAGKTIREISQTTGLSEPDLGRGLLNAVERNIRVRTNVTGGR